MENQNPVEENQNPVEENQDVMEAEKLAKREAFKKKFWKETREWIVSLAMAFLIAMVIRSFVFTLIRVDGGSMMTTLYNNERLFVTVYDVKFGELNRDEVVICRYPNRGRTNFVKRVVAVPGDTVYRKDGVTHVVYEDGETVDKALDPDMNLYYYPSPDYEPYTLGEDEYFVVGDNRYNSHDSRDWNDRTASGDVGPITKNMIIGHVRSVFWPLNAIRGVE